jgi:16S rRNA (guanine527-N7)-methyltransferase
MSVPRETAGAAAALFGPGLPVAEAYAEALSTTGAVRGLIGPREVPRLWDRHLLNCVVLKELIPDGSEVADVGSGAGLPGIPLAIARPDLSVFLVEPLLRRVVWLREIVLALGLANVEIIRGRANAVAETGQKFDVVTARAVLPLPGLLEICLPLLRPGGEVLAMKGDGVEQELREATSVLEQFGAAEWAVSVCGEDILSTPTTVVRVRVGIKIQKSTKPSRLGGGSGPVPRPGAASSKGKPPVRKAQGRRPSAR